MVLAVGASDSGANMKKLFMMALLAAFLSPMVGCKEKGPMEKAGEKVDEAAKDTERKVKDATD